MSESSRNLGPMGSPKSGKLYSLAMFGVVSSLAGLLMAGFVVPFAAMTGATARAGADSLENLPADMSIDPPAQKSRILMADGSLLATFYAENREYVSLDKISPIMQKAQVAIEDNRFFEHGPIDFRGTSRALLSNVAGSSTQGGSTLTQQYVKQVRIEAAAAKGDQAGVNEAQEQTLSRKIQELRYAVAMEKKYSKKEILERYLNIAYYGDGAYGVQAAAKHYFGTTADKLTLPQASMLAGLVQNPTATDPVNNPDAAITRRGVVLARMKQLGVITAAEELAAKKVAFDPSKVTTARKGCIASKYPFVCDYVRHSLMANPALGKTRDDRERLLERGGLTIRTLIDPKAQASAQSAVSSMVGAVDPVIGGTAIVQPGTGLILAMAQSRPVMGSSTGQTYYNYMASQDMGGAEGYQAGSTFKTFTMAAALEKGYSIRTRYTASSPMDFTGDTFTSCRGSFKAGDFEVSNSVGHSTNIDLYEAAAYSVNTYFIQLERDAGLCNVTKMAQKAGVELSNGKDIVKEYQYIPSFTLGIAEVTPLSMAAAYATFAARGVHCDPVIIKSINTAEGTALQVPSASCKRVVSQSVADGVNSVLQGVMNGTGAPATIPGGYPQAGKTGTTDSNEAVWFAGYTPNAAGVALIAADKSSPYFRGRTEKSVKGLSLSTGEYLQGSGGGDAGQIYRKAMAAVLAGKPKTSFTDPTSSIINGKQISLPDTSNMSYDEAQAALNKAGFATQTWRVTSDTPEGTFLGVSPSGKASLGATIYLRISKGPAPILPPQTQSTGGSGGQSQGGSQGGSSSATSSRGTQQSQPSQSSSRATSGPSAASSGRR
ncbi:transglycosylase domain-containing protein [Acidipropionibacterium jensenii]|uniref:transglycosylase domain-containing protein n=1 Tax=Acidipropionibacterium jensenii TaxID=1749 RepID=UPI0034517A17